MEGNRQRGVLGLLERMQPWLILLAGVFYWGAYLHFWFNPHDEGGTAALTAQRILAGEVPIRDVALGYNILWFYPIVWLFQITGVHYVKMRAFFFALSACTALAGWAVVKRVTARSWLAFFVGLLLVVFPGSQFKNYIPLVGMLNLLCLVRTFGRLDLQAGLFGSEWRGSQFYGDCAVGGLVLGLSYLIRIDLGFLFSAIWMGMLVVQLADIRAGFGSKLARLVVGMLLVGGTVWLVHVPALAHARTRGYESQFVSQYTSWAQYLLKSAVALKSHVGSTDHPKPASQAANPGVQPSPSKEKRDTGGLRARPQATDLPGLLSTRNWDAARMWALTYLPLAGFGIWLGRTVFGGIGAWKRREWSTAHPSAQLGIVALSSLATFPQFFFFRPDRPHLSEFMVGYLVVLGCGWASAFRTREGRPGAGAWVLGALCLIHTSLYAWVALDHPSAGTIAARLGRKHWFRAENGVEVQVSQKELNHLTAVRDAILSCSSVGDFVVCYPYQPGYNLMTNRMTYERDLYVDNVTHGRSWATKTIETLEKQRPAAVVIDNRAINGNEESRFNQWAAPAYSFLQKQYRLVGTSKDTEVYGRPVP
jgi:hypothetical protein